MIDMFADFIPRKAYFERLKPYIGSHIIKILTGQRRVGKSYLLHQLTGEIRQRDGDAAIIYINMELAEFRNLKTGGDLYDFVASRLGPKSNYVFIDEVQEIDSFETALQSLFAEGRCELYCTGSNAHLLSGDLATYLAGRYIRFQIHPLSYVEFLEFHRLENGPEALRTYLRIGGMPYLSSLQMAIEQSEPGLPAIAHEYLKNVYESILLRDVMARENIRNIRFMENLGMYLADNTGSLLSANNISKYLKSQQINIPVQTVINYLGALERSFLVHRVSRKKVGGLKIFEVGEKYYFEDMGLRNILALNPLPFDMAKLVENAVYLFLIQRGFTVYVGSADDGTEIDFIAEKQAGRIYVQSCYRLSETALEREFGNLLAIEDNFPKYVVTLDEDFGQGNYRGIQIIPLMAFLLMEL
jgi:predicted AAA+ superfamily ATPase